MYRIEVQNEINQITSLFYFVGFWHRGEEPTVREMRLKLFYLIYYLLFPISVLVGAISSDNRDESIFLMEATMILSVLSLKLFYIVQKKKEILELFNEICVYSSDDRGEFILVSEKLKIFVKYVKAFIILAYPTCICAAIIVPFVGSDRTLFLNIAFPSDYKNNDIGFWIAFAFFLSQIFLSMIAVLFSIIIWYVMFNCALQYKVLGHRIRNMGVMKPILEEIEATGSKRKMSEAEIQNIYLVDLIEAVKSLNHIRDLVNKSESFFATIFLVRLATSGLCICGSIYSLVFGLSNNFLERMIYVAILLYNIFEIFMVMYLGNEIKLSSDRLSYCLFESNWVDKSESIKKYVIIFGELLKQFQVMVIGKLYPLTLETFTRIIRSAYSMFNILKDMNHN